MNTLRLVLATAKKEPGTFCVRLLLCLPLTLLITACECSALLLRALRAELRNRFPYAAPNDNPKP